jgi:hypothetical protein
VAKLTVALTPSTALRAFSTVLTHDEQVIPSIDNVVGSNTVLIASLLSARPSEIVSLGTAFN